ncbi:MAG: hypothetical protein ACI837_002448 [Crocinitomicaceae bacterium]|jgi:hypothetical protein
MKRNIDIKEPCSENWDAMLPTQRGAFCESCALEVHDFTNNSGDEIRDILKLNLGSRVCGKINPSQLDALNADFNVWQMNSKRSFQSALVFALIVAFGMTLFSCEEEEEERKIGNIQQAGMTFFFDLDKSSFFAGKSAEHAVQNIPPHVPVVQEEIVREQYVLGAMRESNNDLHEAPARILEYHSSIKGGMSHSAIYSSYLSPVEEIYNHSVAEEIIEFEAFTFPNPAQERTTLRIMLPKETMVQVQLFSMSGQMIQTISMETLSKGENNLPINLLDVPNGTYLISIRSEDFKESVRFVKM